MHEVIEVWGVLGVERVSVVSVAGVAKELFDQCLLHRFEVVKVVVARIQLQLVCCPWQLLQRHIIDG